MTNRVRPILAGQWPMGDYVPDNGHAMAIWAMFHRNGRALAH